MRKELLQKNTGFVALISAVIISAILLIIATTLSLSGFYGRYDILESELKERSSSIADACVDVALLKLANDSSYSPTNETITIDDVSCTIKSVMTSGSTKTISIQAIYKNYYTNLLVNVNSSTLSINSWQETDTL